MKYANAAALRAALDQRLVSEANTSGTDVARLRRRVTFERLLVRFALAGADRWVLKGGAAVEMRVADRARTTKDLDLAARHIGADDADVREALVEALLSDPQGDFFEFRLDKFKAVGIDGAIGPVWRAGVDCRLDGRTFDHVVIDIVVRTSEVQRTEWIPLLGTLAFADLPTVEIVAVDLHQHFAEKLHALVRNYGDRPSSRVKDLADLVLFIDGGLQPTAELVAAVADVFTARGFTEAPIELPDPPSAWPARYAELAEDLQLSAHDIEAAMITLRTFWARAVNQSG
jgi:hypothetical protein